MINNTCRKISQLLFNLKSLELSFPVKTGTVHLLFFSQRSAFVKIYCLVYKLFNGATSLGLFLRDFLDASMGSKIELSSDWSERAALLSKTLQSEASSCESSGS
jgi:hypothetical protein